MSTCLSCIPEVFIRYKVWDPSEPGANERDFLMEGMRGGGGRGVGVTHKHERDFPHPTLLKKVRFTLNMKHVFFDAML